MDGLPFPKTKAVLWHMQATYDKSWFQNLANLLILRSRNWVLNSFEAVLNAERAGVFDPLLVKVPADWTELVSSPR